MEKLLVKNCPFCALGALYLTKQYITEENDYETEIFCNHCKIYFRREDDYGDVDKNEKAMIDFWNKERC